MLQPFFFNVNFIHFQNKNHSSVTVAPLEVSETMTGDWLQGDQEALQAALSAISERVTTQGKQ